MTDDGHPAATSERARLQRYRLNRAGIHNVWQYDNHVFHFADGRLLLRGRNGAGKSKALEMLLPFLLDGDARRLDTTGTSRTSLRWLMLEGRTATETGSPDEDDGAADTVDDVATSTLGHLWVEFTGRGPDGEERWRTLGAAITASAATAEARAVFFVTERRIGVDLDLVRDGRPLSIEKLRGEIGAEDCYETPAAYRARVMRELFGIDDPRRYRNLMHLLYRLRRPTVGERIEAGELVAVLAEALPPMDESVLDEVARNIADLDDARARLTALRSAKEQTDGFLDDYRRYLHGSLRRQSRIVREQIDAHERRDAEVTRLEAELDELVATESSIQEERDRLRRTRDTANSDAATLSAGSPGAPAPSQTEQQARYAAVTAYIRAAEAASAAAGHALTSEECTKDRLTADIAAIDRDLSELRARHAELAADAEEVGLDLAELGHVPETIPTILAPRESVTHVSLEGLEQATERDPVHGIDLDHLRGLLAELHDRLTRADTWAAQREEAATALRDRAIDLTAAQRRENGLAAEAEWCDSRLERARERERAAIDGVRAASAAYADSLREWSASLRAAEPDADLTAPLAELEEKVELPLDDSLRVLETTVCDEVTRHAYAIVDPLLEELRTRRDTTVGEERELATELDELSERRGAITDHIAAPAPSWVAAPRDETAGAPFYLAVDFADGVTTAQRAGLEAALESSGLLAGWITAAGTVVSAYTRDLLLTPGPPRSGPTLRDVLVPAAGTGVDTHVVDALLASICLSEGDSEDSDEHGDESDTGRAAETADSHEASVIGLDGRWRLGVASGCHHKTAPEYIGDEARTEARDRQLAKIDRRIAIAEALLAEAGERRGDIEHRATVLTEIARSVPTGAELTSAWAAVDNARAWFSEAERDHAAAQRAAEAARETALDARARLLEMADEHALPRDREELTTILTALARLRVRISAAHSDLEALAVLLEEYRGHVQEWERARADRVLAEDARTAAIGDMITVRRETELTDRARSAAPEQIDTAIAEVRSRGEEAANHLPELERAAQRARDDRVAAETRHDVAVRERAEQARRALDAGATLRAMLGPSGTVAADGTATAGTLLKAAGCEHIAEPTGPLARYDTTEGDTDSGEELAKRIEALNALLTDVEAAIDGDSAGDLADSDILGRREELHRALASGGPANALTELTETAGVKRVTVHDDDGSHDITVYAERLDSAIQQAEETVALREEEAYERHLLGDLASHLSRQIEDARALIATMNDVLSEVHTSQGLGVRLDWRLAPDADEDITAVVPLLERPAEKRSRVETTRLRDALRRCIEAIRRLDPTATTGAQLRAALDYRSWFSFTAYVTNASQSGRERRLSHRTALSQGEQRVIAYLVLFAAAAAQFGALAAEAPQSPRLILLDDAFAKVDEPTHGRLLGMLVELDLDFVLTSERLWGCFPSVPNLHIYECLRDPAEPGIATLHFTWDGNRRRLKGV
ncbi:TIGR02680 family protein [Salinactinospora qingdaonensis]|uniref:TIGR02680 family protein n=1 Tax=Salinactinospora qingdaonensis TaxID=702744 RepID=A0ABP7G3K3_9ACTN